MSGWPYGHDDLGEWWMLNEHGERVLTPCCAADWLEPALMTALCASCFKPWEVSLLGVVKGECTREATA